MTNRNEARSQRTGHELMEEIRTTVVPYGTAAIWFLGQESVVVKGGDTTIYIDPYYSSGEGTSSRAFPPPLAPQDITQASFVLITHEHSDHLDPDTLSVIAEQCPESVFTAPVCCHNVMLEVRIPEARIRPALTDEWVDYGSFRLKAIPAAHEELDEQEGQGHRYVGYLLDMNGVMIYHAGDTVVYPGLLERLQEQAVDIGMVPINGADAFRRSKGIVGNMGFREAGDLAYEAGFDLTIPLHYDLFPMNSEKPGYFIDYCYENYPYMRNKVMARTERLIYVKGS
ncbi:MBL fold metallo-hydrolase [Paenibacillus lemnae]|uniref:MBL fold metallo-hydrolase n=1 Tax=Paenibacillus lemnae TaxID=1330551 RepID=A0A848M4W5_PAELE|nr:MBL fold metallo-hydrolase [Paenibacillus lemnae]NMO95987.1 MBL fold metallo-hydrolase [Paenibacillus lemnae]